MSVRVARARYASVESTIPIGVHAIVVARRSRGRRAAPAAASDAASHRTGPFATRTCRCVSGDAPRASYESSTASRHGARVGSGRQGRPGPASDGRTSSAHRRCVASRVPGGRLCTVGRRARWATVHCRSSREMEIIVRTLTQLSRTRRRGRSGRSTALLSCDDEPRIFQFRGLCALCSLRCQRATLTFLSEASQRRRPCRGGRAPRSAYWRRWRQSALPRH